MQHPVGMGRGYPGYGGIPTSAAAAGYGGAAPGAAPGYGYGMICLNTVLSSTQAITFLWKLKLFYGNLKIYYLIFS